LRELDVGGWRRGSRREKCAGEGRLPRGWSVEPATRLHLVGATRGRADVDDEVVEMLRGSVYVQAHLAVGAFA
jgi:hypothetical protein